jgi:hypothetical protein
VSAQVGTNPDNQRTRELVVVEKGAAYTAVDTEFRSPEFYPWGEPQRARLRPA